MNNFYGLGQLLGYGGPNEWLARHWVLLAVVGLWSLLWKCVALWRSARNGDKGWFVAVLILNTLGILDILYIYVFSKKSGSVEKVP